MLEKLGAPLMAAVDDVSVRQNAAEHPDQKQDAERVAELLNKTVQISIALSAVMDLKDADGDSLRLALAGMAAPLIAGHYRLHARVPGDNDIKRMIKSLEAVLTFSDNFAPAAENNARLENLSPGPLLLDEAQVTIQYVNVLVPVIDAIAAFPFGRPENKLAQEVADRLVSAAGTVAAQISAGADAQQLKQNELRVLAAFAALYVVCHKAETARLMAMDDAARAQAAEQAGGMLPMDPVWQAFEQRRSMASMIAGMPNAGSISQTPVAVPDKAVSPAGPATEDSPPASEAPFSPFATPPKPVEPQMPPMRQEPDPAPPPVPPQPPAAPEPPPAESDQPYNPMGFFSGKKSDENDEQGAV